MKKLMVLMIGTVLLITGCQQNENVSTTPTETPVVVNNMPDTKAMAEKLTTSDWKWVKMATSDDTMITPTKPDAFIVTFAQGQISSTTDCNQLSGIYNLEKEKMVIGELASTKMFCENSQEAVYSTALTQVESYTIDEGGLFLILKDKGGTMRFDKKEKAA